MMLSSLVILLALGFAAANPITSTTSCKDYKIPLNISSLDYIWGLPPNENNYDVTTVTTNIARWDANVTLNPISGASPVTIQYEISGTFCSPPGGGDGTVLIATHGFGFDRNYWDPAIEPENYSFVDYAVAKGYSVFYYDRLGVSKSSQVSGYVAQVSNQLAILEQLIAQARAGAFGLTPKKIVLVGHSFGSVLSNAILATSPDLVDGAVLTGIGYDILDTSVAFEAWQPRLASVQSPARWRQLDGGYITWVDIYANVNTFFKAPFYDTKVVEYAENNKEPFSLMEVITLSQTDLRSSKYIGPVLVIAGEYDLIFCNGCCPPLLEPAAKAVFNASENLVVYSQPGSGHGINFSLNATGAFEVITNFLASNGL